MKAQVTLTVSESKRLIARGVAALDVVRARMRQGMISVCTGTTNAYVLEELLGERFDKRTYVTGKIVPTGKALEWPKANRPDAVLRDGKLVPDLDRFSAVRVMRPGDIVIKGANALNYEWGVAGILVSGEGAGTIGNTMGYIVQKKLRLILPVGLEKCVPYPIEEAAATDVEDEESLNTVVSLYPVHGQIVTEIEALETLAGVEAIPWAAGGIAGAEGSVTLLLKGDGDAVRRAMAIIEEIRGEPPFYPL